MTVVAIVVAIVVTVALRGLFAPAKQAPCLIRLAFYDVIDLVGDVKDPALAKLLGSGVQGRALLEGLLYLADGHDGCWKDLVMDRVYCNNEAQLKEALRSVDREEDEEYARDLDAAHGFLYALGAAKSQMEGVWSDFPHFHDTTALPAPVDEKILLVRAAAALASCAVKVSGVIVTPEELSNLEVAELTRAGGDDAVRRRIRELRAQRA